jgi:hypothetical protein
MLALLGWTMLVAPTPIPRGYPSSYRDIAANAASERALLVYSTINGPMWPTCSPSSARPIRRSGLSIANSPRPRLYRTFVDCRSARRPAQRRPAVERGDGSADQAGQ